MALPLGPKSEKRNFSTTSREEGLLETYSSGLQINMRPKDLSPHPRKWRQQKATPDKKRKTQKCVENSKK